MRLVFVQYLELELELRQHREQEVAVDVVELQDEVEHVLGQIADGRLPQHQHLVEELMGKTERGRGKTVNQTGTVQTRGRQHS